jgi:hypothetical protein
MTLRNSDFRLKVEKISRGWRHLSFDIRTLLESTYNSPTKNISINKSKISIIAITIRFALKFI